MKSFRIYSTLSEKQIEADISNYFGWISPIGQTPFRLLDVNEQIYAADKRFNCAIPIYMQFKVSQGLKRLPALVPHIPNFSYRIRSFRRKNDLYDNPTLYFKLRDIAPSAEDFQHNILLSLANAGQSHAFYVAPLTLDKDDYYKMLTASADRFMPFPFHYDNNIIHQENWISYLGMVPFLRGNISITPHERVSSSKHYYSFSPTGTEIAWHSPKIISHDASRLSDRLIEIFKDAFVNKKNWVDLDEYAALIKNKYDFYQGKEVEKNTDSSSLQRILDFGKMLHRKYYIRQMLILSNRESLNKLT